MNPWQILEIAPTNDKTQIKRAFAKKLKENPPDKDAALYQKIREAYNAALRLSEYVSSEAESDEVLSESENEFAGESEVSDFDSNESEESESEEDSEVSVETVGFSEEDSDEEDDYDLDEDFFSEKETSSLSFDMSEIQKVRDSMQGTGNAHTLSEILGAFTVKHWRFSPFRRTPFFFTALLFFQIALGIYVIARLFDFGK